MEEIKVGDFIRTIKGEIFKINKIAGNDYITDIKFKKHTDYIGIYSHEIDDYLFSLTKEQVNECKHSPNIIDLIEEGDYVNGYKVAFISEDYAKFVQCDYPVEAGTTNHYKFYKESIRDIVTKEQYNSMKYIVGDE